MFIQFYEYVSMPICFRISESWAYDYFIVRKSSFIGLTCGSNASPWRYMGWIWYLCKRYIGIRETSELNESQFFFVNSTIRDLSVRLFQDEKGILQPMGAGNPANIYDVFTKYIVLQWTMFLLFRYTIYATGDIILQSIKMLLVVLFSSPQIIQGLCWQKWIMMLFCEQ